ncbi:hypothetical protein [Streptomyces flavofungini]|nr:hypothetical protein [Streptomyces flavofungini]WJV45239.1 hypothetical protein QUY26_06595 [Streptomyces flavofungini]
MRRKIGVLGGLALTAALGIAPLPARSTPLLTSAWAGATRRGPPT